MKDASQSAAGGDGKKATQSADDARRKLGDTRRKLKGERDRVANELAQEQMAKLEDMVRGLRAQQQSAHEETQGFEKLRAKQGDLTRAQATDLLALARQQKAIAVDAAALAERLGRVAGFAFTLSAAAGEMQRAAAALERRATGEAAQRPQRKALARLDMLLEAVKPEEPSEQPGDDNGGNGGNPGGPGANPPAHSLAEVKLLALLQADINRRTHEVQAAIEEAGKPGDDERRELAALAEEQGRLAEMVLELIPPQEPTPNPERQKEGEP
jgi:hypothetical protein